MADWTEVPDSNLGVDSPGRSIDIISIKDNITALAEAANGAPKIVAAAFERSTANTGLQIWTSHDQRDTAERSYRSTSSYDDEFRSVGVRFFGGGSVRMSLKHRAVASGNDARIRVLKNGIQLTEWTTTSTTASTRTQNVTVEVGDILVFQQVAVSGSSRWSELQITANKYLETSSGVGA